MIAEYAYAYDLDLHELYNRMQEMYLRLAERAECYVVKGNPRTYYETILPLLKK